ncbi:MAG: RsmB/NOP family class I SAM-dependent RNA methyltransferase, partial [Patescibacteria group bacterium]
MKEIPLEAVFIDRLNKMFGESIAQKVVKGFSVDRSPVIRVNTLKTSVRDIMSYFKEINVRFERVGFLPDALIILNKKEKFFEELDVYKNGKIYFHGISSQFPVKFLDLQPGEKILDMCAAPGSKTTQIAAMMQNKGEITANEINMIRLERLKYNLNKQGVTIANVISYDGAVLGDMYPASFDKFLLDAPC